jgi:hypothetical protein
VIDRSHLDWQHRRDYIRSRSTRRPGDTDIEPEWADEAANDPMAQVIDPDPASTSGRGVRIIGYSPTAAMVITVIALEDDGTTFGVNAWRANASDERDYWEDT